MPEFSVTQERFSGPFDVLLEFLEKEQLAITDISLAQITEEYLAFLEEETVAPEELGDFLAVASRLLWLKSKAILPLPSDTEEEGSSLVDQLRLYQLFVQSAELLQERFLETAHAFPRPKPTSFLQPMFLPPPSVTLEIMEQTFRSFLQKLRPLFTLQTAAMERVMSVQEKIVYLREAVLAKTRLSFRELFAQGGSRLDVVVSFLAILELTKQRVVRVTQSGLFDDLTIHQAK